VGKDDNPRYNNKGKKKKKSTRPTKRMVQERGVDMEKGQSHDELMADYMISRKKGLSGGGSRVCGEWSGAGGREEYSRGLAWSLH